MNKIYVFFTGLCMGAADVVPGVSGGTMAFIMGVYEKLLEGIQSFNLQLLKNLFKGDFKAIGRDVPWAFLGTLFLGIIAAFLSLAKIVSHLYENEQILLFAFFFGLILASVYVLASSVPWNAARLASLVAGTLIGLLIVSLTPRNMPQDPITLFFCGAVAIMAMILPGISGSFILLILGQYAWVLDQIEALIDALKAFEIGPVFQIGFSILPLALGAVVGLLSFARLLRWVLDRFHWGTVALLIGFMIGSLRKIWPWKEITESRMVHGEEKIISDKMTLPELNQELLFAVLLCIVGIALILGIEEVRKRKQPTA